MTPRPCIFEGGGVSESNVAERARTNDPAQYTDPPLVGGEGIRCAGYCITVVWIITRHQTPPLGPSISQLTAAKHHVE